MAPVTLSSSLMQWEPTPVNGELATLELNSNRTQQQQQQAGCSVLVHPHVSQIAARSGERGIVQALNTISWTSACARQCFNVGCIVTPAFAGRGCCHRHSAALSGRGESLGQEAGHLGSTRCIYAHKLTSSKFACAMHPPALHAVPAVASTHRVSFA